jgi:hypothetical protein
LTRSSHLAVALAALPLLVALGVVRAAEAAVCSVADLCPAPSGNCTPANKLECDSPAIFDLGGRPLVIPADKSLTVSRGDGQGVLSISGAGSLSLQGKIQAQGDDGDSGQVVIATSGPVTLAAASTIDVSATFDGGYVEIEGQSGDVRANGLLKASAGRDGEGGEVVLTARDGSITVGGLGINASASGEFSGGGSVTLSASADASLQGPVSSPAETPASSTSMPTAPSSPGSTATSKPARPRPAGSAGRLASSPGPTCDWPARSPPPRRATTTMAAGWAAGC